MSSPSGIPSLGPRGEGWVAGQFALLALVAALGVRAWVGLPPVDLLGWLRVAAGSMLMLSGFIVGWRGVRALQRNLTALPRPRDDARLVESGIYARIRHPMYAALILAAAGWSLVTASVGAGAVTVLLAAWLDLKARREEAWLAERFDGYPAYRRRTHRFIPGLY